MEEVNIVASPRWFSWNVKSKSLSIFRCITLLTTIIVIIGICIWCFNLRWLTDDSTHFYTGYKNVSYSRMYGFRHRRFDIVLSYYGENIEFVQRYIRYLKNVSSLNKVRLRIIVYNKNSNVNNTILRNDLNADIVHLLPNLGREGGTYLYHIIENYKILADHTLFSQAGVEGITDTGLTDWLADRLENQFNASIGYMPLVHTSMISKDLCGKHASGNFQRLTDLWGILQQTLCPINGFSVAFRGQFLVSKQRIVGRSLDLYKYLYELITANSTHWIHTDPRSPPEWSSKPEQPSFGYVVERLWTILFNCSNPDLFERCEKKQCACLD